MTRKIATEDVVEVDRLLEFVRSRNDWVLSSMRSDGRPQLSPVTGGVGPAGELLVASYPSRDKVHNLRRDPRTSVCVLSKNFGDAWVQIDGRATVIDVPEAVDGLVDYFRAIAGEHPDWDEYREAMVAQGKSLITIDIERWGPIATGGFPAAVSARLGD